MPSPPSRSTTSSGTQRYALLFKPGTYGIGRRPAQLPGRLLHRGGRPRRRRRPTSPSTATVDVYNQCCARQLHRAQQLLALAVEPDDQRHRPRLSAAQPATSGPSRRRRRCAGSTSPAATYAHGLLHRSVIRERRLHRRLAVSAASSSTARSSSSGARQQHRRLDQRRLEPGLLRRRRARRPSASRPRRTCRGPYTTLATSPVTARSPTCTSTPPARYNVFVPGARTRTRSGTTWANGPTAGSLHPDRTVLRRQADRLRADRSTTRSPAGKNLLFTPGVYHARPDDQGQARRHRRARPRLRHPRADRRASPR